ncbi:hypothetical protein VKS41_007681 [Umbelopsis sp. WA50703]
MAFPHPRPKPKFSLFAADPPEPRISWRERIKAHGKTIPGITVTSFVLGISGGVLVAAMFKHYCSSSGKIMTIQLTNQLDDMRHQLENGGGVPYVLQDEEFVRSSRQRGVSHQQQGVVGTVRYHLQQGWNQGIEHIASALNSIIER